MGVNLEELIKPKGEVFQRLAAILEFERVVMEYREKGDWNQVKSGLPIHFDASCNGFQHVSALLQDSDLARKVNLLKPEDGGVVSRISTVKSQNMQNLFLKRVKTLTSENIYKKISTFLVLMKKISLNSEKFSPEV